MQASAAAGDSARGKNDYPSGGLHELASRPCQHSHSTLPCPAPGHSIPQGQPQQGLAVAVLLHLPQECHTLPAPEHPRARPQPLLVPRGSDRAAFPTRQPSSTTETS